MAPEVFRGEHGTAKSDVYSFSVMAYELLAKRRPILGESVEELQIAHMTKIPMPLKNMSAAVPRSLAKLIDRGLSKEVGFRPTMRDFRVIFSDILVGDKVIENDTSTQEQIVPTPSPAESGMVFGRAPKVAPEAAPKVAAKQGIISKLFGRK